MKKNNKGFTLIELMIVVAIIAIISAIAIPSLMKTKMQANESAAAGSLKTLHLAQANYHRDFGQYAMDLRDLFGIGMSIYTPHIDDEAMYNAGIAENVAIDATISLQPALLATAATAIAKSGYFYFSNHEYNGEQFMMGTTPGAFNVGGRKSYFVNTGSTIYEMDPAGIVALDEADEVAADYNDDLDWNVDGSGGAGPAWKTAH